MNATVNISVKASLPFPPYKYKMVKEQIKKHTIQHMTQEHILVTIITRKDFKL